MRLINSNQAYGLFSVVMHWLVAVIVIGMFALGVWMVGLGYYDTWYHKAPALHKSIGFILFSLMILRVLWRTLTPQPRAINTHSTLVRFMAKAGHLLIYFMLFAIMITGYLISTAEGVGIPVFGWFEVPALISELPNQADLAGDLHRWLAWGLIAVVIGHAGAALKHHFIDKDATLVRIFGKH